MREYPLIEDIAWHVLGCMVCNGWVNCNTMNNRLELSVKDTNQKIYSVVYQE